MLKHLTTPFVFKVRVRVPAARMRPGRTSISFSISLPYPLRASARFLEETLSRIGFKGNERENPFWNPYLDAHVAMAFDEEYPPTNENMELTGDPFNRKLVFHGNWWDCHMV